MSHLSGVKGSNLYDLLHSCSAAETPGDFSCDKCKAKGLTTMARVLVKLPKILVIWLKMMNFVFKNDELCTKNDEFFR